MVFEGLLHQYVCKGVILGAFDSGTLVGVCGMVQPGRCQATTTEKLRRPKVLFGFKSQHPRPHLVSPMLYGV